MRGKVIQEICPRVTVFVNIQISRVFEDTRFIRFVAIEVLQIPVISVCSSHRRPAD